MKTESMQAWPGRQRDGNRSQWPYLLPGSRGMQLWQKSDFRKEKGHAI